MESDSKRLILIRLHFDQKSSLELQFSSGELKIWQGDKPTENYMYNSNQSDLSSYLHVGLCQKLMQKINNNQYALV